MVVSGGLLLRAALLAVIRNQIIAEPPPLRPMVLTLAAQVMAGIKGRRKIGNRHDAHHCHTHQQGGQILIRFICIVLCMIACRDESPSLRALCQLEGMQWIGKIVLV